MKSGRKKNAKHAKPSTKPIRKLYANCTIEGDMKITSYETIEETLDYWTKQLYYGEKY